MATSVRRRIWIWVVFPEPSMPSKTTNGATAGLLFAEESHVAAGVDADAEGAKVVFLRQYMLESPDVGALVSEVHVLLAVEDALSGLVGFLQGTVEGTVVVVVAALPALEELLHLGGGILAHHMNRRTGLLSDSDHTRTPLIVGLGGQDEVCASKVSDHFYFNAGVVGGLFNLVAAYAEEKDTGNRGISGEGGRLGGGWLWALYVREAPVLDGPSMTSWPASSRRRTSGTSG